jgi:hypothetical protein
MSSVVNGMDLNTTMVSKMQKMVKNIKGRYVKTHLYRILVHRWKLCCNVWIDAHHKHDSNQVVTSIMRILNYVYNARDELLQILYIWAKNCAYKNKNKYLFGLCATLGFFEEVRVGFLLVGYTYLGIDQWFSCIPHVLKGDDINFLLELLSLIQMLNLNHTNKIV